MAHKGHSICEQTSKAACEKARRIAIGQCSAMISETKQCPHWGVDSVEDRAYCGQHINSVYLTADAKRRSDAKKAEMNDRADAWLASQPERDAALLEWWNERERSGPAS